MTSTSNMGPKAPVILQVEKLNDFSDYVVLRDAKGRSLRPALVPCLQSGRERLQVRDDFTICCDYAVSPAQGTAFLDITQDPNDIHAKQNILPGALAVAKMLLPIEILVPDLRIHALRAKFRAAAFYNERTVNAMRWEYVNESSIRIDVTAYQSQRPVASANVFGEILASPCYEEIKERKVNAEQLQRVRDFLEILGVRPEAYLAKDGIADLTYPFAFMASLPSGEIVRQLEGQGGMITTLSLDLSDRAKMPITGRSGPEVRLRKGRIRQAFWKIITDIIDGLVTYYRGAALVNPTAFFT